MAEPNANAVSPDSSPSSLNPYPLAMSRILITSGPTRQYLDPVRYLTNASSGRMGAALAAAAIEAGPRGGDRQRAGRGGLSRRRPRSMPVVSTEEMLDACLEVFPDVRRPDRRGRPLRLSAGRRSRRRRSARPASRCGWNWSKRPTSWPRSARSSSSQWMVAFALETEDRRLRAMQKLERKSCDLIVVNGPEAMHAADTQVEVIDVSGKVLAALSGSKPHVAAEILQVIQRRLIDGRRSEKR